MLNATSHITGVIFNFLNGEASVNTQVVLCVFLMLERANVKGHGVYRSSGVCVCDLVG